MFKVPLIKSLSLAGAALAMTAGSLVAAAPAEAQRYGYYGDRYDRGYDRDGYRDRGRYDRGYRNDRGWRDDRGYRDRGRNPCKDGDGGTIIGAIAGGLLGRTVDTRGDRALGTILGAGAGALAGRAIDRSDRPNFCR
ncbi:glycine zipper 2TM domain-containing protein [Sphingomonas carotinifaciens]|uniref:glycine zipper 2TM domain-containing protein n=1 Tax=Sphingomonas carotinifaciens TaxID=1166323 RepID=UPI0039A246CA